MDEIKIEKGVPMPVRHKYAFAFEKMEVGDSFFAPTHNRSAISSVLIRATHKWGYKFATRKEGEGIRVWRIA